MVDPEVDHEVGRLTHGCGEIVPWRSTLAPGAQHVLRGKKRLVVSSAPIVTEYLDFFPTASTQQKCQNLASAN